MKINAHTKIASLIKSNPAALEAIISISPRFEKLRNPLLRKLMAARTSIAMAAKAGNVAVDDFYRMLVPLGFTIDENPETPEETPNPPSFRNHLNPGDVQILDVRPVIQSGEDPLPMIMSRIVNLPKGKALKVINSFEPTPLIRVLEKKGFSASVTEAGPDLVETIFYKNPDPETAFEEPITHLNENDQLFDKVKTQYKKRLIQVDVRHLEMPQPMIQILETLKALPESGALYVIHKKIPLYLLPELTELNFGYLIRETGPNEVHLLIYRKENEQ